jgi:putative membrane protein
MSELALTGVVVVGILYALGIRDLRGGRAKRERGRRSEAFYVGLVALAVAISPPLDDLADRLFWAHMAQHAVLQMVAPALIVLGAPWLVVWRVFPLRGRRSASRWALHSRAASPLRLLGRAVTVPAVAWLLFFGAIAVSHLPAVFDFAERHAAAHRAEHVLFLALGLLFWSRVFDSPPFRASLTRVRRLGFLLAAGVAETAVSVAIMAAHSPLYEPYRTLTPRPEHLTALADQQLGGAIMFEPASIPLLFAVLWSIGTLLAPKSKPRTA